nr:hypothetical protein [Allosalinactinospora lopnorensis]
MRRSYRRYGWTIWHGDTTGQYWAAHTGRMVLLSGDSDTELAEAINRFHPALPRETGTARHWPARRLPPRPRPRTA